MRFLSSCRVQHLLNVSIRFAWSNSISLRRSLSSNHTNKLRILFCGSDEFSIQSLEALHKYAQSKGTKIDLIEVATRTDKRTGRGLKNVTAPPIKHVAQRLGLALHQFDTFRGWNLPTVDESEKTYINMIIAVSFGLLVPPRILNACEFGGLNLHPSMLPDLKGSAPIEHAIMHGYKSTGITIQTLHPTKFDEGRIVLQTPQPGLAIPDPDHITSDELRSNLAPIGADMLVETLRDGLYLRDSQNRASSGDVRHAFKITPESRHVNFKEMNGAMILRLNRALSRLWFQVGNLQEQAVDTRVILGQMLRLAGSEDIQAVSMEMMANLEVGIPFTVVKKGDNIKHSKAPLFVKLPDASILLISEVLVSSMKMGHAAAKAAKANLFKEPLLCDKCDLYQFKNPPT